MCNIINKYLTIILPNFLLFDSNNIYFECKILFARWQAACSSIAYMAMLNRVHSKGWEGEIIVMHVHYSTVAVE